MLVVVAIGDDDNFKDEMKTWYALVQKSNKLQAFNFFLNNYLQNLTFERGVIGLTEVTSQNFVQCHTECMQNNYCDPEFRITMTTASFTSAECQETQTTLTFSELNGTCRGCAGWFDASDVNTKSTRTRSLTVDETGNKEGTSSRATQQQGAGSTTTTCRR
jgi:hypothetical protein